MKITLAIPALLFTFSLLLNSATAQKKQRTYKPVKAIVVKDKAAAAVKPVEKKVLMDINLNNFSVSETTRQRIDNGDCKRVFGSIKLELWELDQNNEMKTRIYAYNRGNEVLYSEKETSAPPPIARSHYQEPAPTNPEIMNTVTYNIPEKLLNDKKIMLVVKTQLGTRHKDNDFASYDFLCMEKEKRSTYLLGNKANTPISIKVNTSENYSGRDLHINDLVIPFAIFQNTDDTHYIWTQINCKKK